MMYMQTLKMFRFISTLQGSEYEQHKSVSTRRSSQHEELDIFVPGWQHADVSLQTQSTDICW